MSESDRPDDERTEVATLRYMARFQCIGGDCEDTCCYGWSVEVGHRSFERLERAATGQREEMARLDKTFIPMDEAGLTPEGRPARYQIPLSVDVSCPMLESDGACHIHRLFGEALLPRICATYPRQLNDIGGQLELHAALSCPEVARQLLVPSDATEPVSIARERVPAQTPPRTVDTGDTRPLWRTQKPVRRLLLELLTLPDRPLENRLFYLAWFSHRVAGLLDREVTRSDDAALSEQMALVRDPDVREELDRRFAELETPAMVALLVARLIVDLPRHPNQTWTTYMELVDSVLESYGPLRPLWKMAEEDDATPDDLDARPVWRAYRERRRRVRARLGDRIDEVLGRIAQHYFHLRPNRDSPDLFSHVLRLLTELTAIKLLVYSHPRLLPDGEETAGNGQKLNDVLDEVAVEVAYKVSRFVEHSRMLQRFEQLLEERSMRSLAGAVYLIRF